MLSECRTRLIELPTSDRVERVVRSALHHAGLRRLGALAEVGALETATRAFAERVQRAQMADWFPDAIAPTADDYAAAAAQLDRLAHVHRHIADAIAGAGPASPLREHLLNHRTRAATAETQAAQYRRDAARADGGHDTVA